MADERRNNGRINTASAGLAVHNAIDDSNIGIVGNISIGGLMLISRNPMYQDGTLQVSLRSLPGAVDADSIELGINVLWVTPANSPGEHWAGVEIIDASDEARRAYGQLLDYFRDKSAR